MADKKISALTSATTPLAGTEVLPIVQGGATVKVTVDNLTAGKTVSMSNLTVSGTATFAAGAVGTPSITTAGDTNTGIFFPAADTIAFAEGGVESMRIDSSGNVGIGTSSPQGAFGRSLHLYNDANTGTVASNTYLAVESVNRNAVIELSGSSTATNRVNFSDTLGTAVAGVGSGISDSNLFFATGGSTERMRIDSSGNVGIGTSTPSSKLTVVAATNAGINVNDGTVNTIIYNSSGGVASIGTTSNHPVDLFANNAARVRIATNGIVTMNAYGAGTATFSAAGVISSVSDETWKIKDGVPVDPDAMLKKLEPGYWYYNDEKKETFGADRQLGFYAQNVNAAIGPEAAPTPEEGKPWGYHDRSVLAVTVMSLQKALATIESLTARITALENK